MELLKSIRDRKVYIKDIFSVIFRICGKSLAYFSVFLLPIIALKFGYLEYIMVTTSNLSDIPSIKSVLLDKKLYTGEFKSDIKKDILYIGIENGIKDEHLDTFINDKLFYGVKIDARKGFSGDNGKSYNDSFKYKKGEYTDILNTMFVYDINVPYTDRIIPYSPLNKTYEQTILHEFIHYINGKSTETSKQAYGIIQELIKDNANLKQCVMKGDCESYHKMEGTDTSNTLVIYYSEIIKRYTGEDEMEFYKRIFLGNPNDKDMKILNELSAFSLMDTETVNLVKTSPYGKELVSLYFD